MCNRKFALQVIHHLFSRCKPRTQVLILADHTQSMDCKSRFKSLSIRVRSSFWAPGPRRSKIASVFPGVKLGVIPAVAKASKTCRATKISIGNEKMRITMCQGNGNVIGLKRSIVSVRGPCAVGAGVPSSK